MTEIIASDYLDPNKRIVKSGELLARRVIEGLRTGDFVQIQLRGLPGMSSSYFNVLLMMIRDELGAEALERVGVSFISPLQKQIFDRSLEAVLHAATP